MMFNNTQCYYFYSLAWNIAQFQNFFVCDFLKMDKLNSKDVKDRSQGQPSITVEDYDCPKKDVKKIWRRLMTVVMATNGLGKVAYSYTVVQ